MSFTLAGPRTVCWHVNIEVDNSESGMLVGCSSVNLEPFGARGRAFDLVGAEVIRTDIKLLLGANSSENAVESRREVIVQNSTDHAGRTATRARSQQYLLTATWIVCDPVATFQVVCLQITA